jgi:nitric oxide dioxygenase
MSQRLKAGDLLEVSAPFGNFVLPDTLADPTNTQPIVFMAGGIGVTPVLSMLKTLVQRGAKAPMYLLYAVNNSASHAFDNEFEEIARVNPSFNYHVVYSEPKDGDKQVRFMRNFFSFVFHFTLVFASLLSFCC